jgi:beta-glucuronidase
MVEARQGGSELDFAEAEQSLVKPFPVCFLRYHEVVEDALSLKIQLGALVAFLLMFVTTGQAQQPTPLITNIEGRHRIDLNGRWQTIIDPYETGYYDYRYQPSANGFFKNAKPKSPGDLVEYDFDASPQLNVPGDWNSQDQKLLF